MTARQPPGEKGAKACTIGCDLSRDGYFCAYFSGETTKKESKSMKNGARYVVTTHWGTFSLDEASYQDYLAGRLWISWNPGKQEQSKPTSTGYIPPNVTDQATLLSLIKKKGLKNSNVYKKANISKQHFSKIINDPNAKPSKQTAIALALALELDLYATRDLIGRAGFALTNSSISHIFLFACPICIVVLHSSLRFFTVLVVKLRNP